MNTQHNYSVSLITCEEQLTQAFYMRYRIYKKMYPLSVQKLIQPAESDDFDKRSIHLGLYVDTTSGKNLVGYCRFIIPPIYEGNFSDFLIQKHPDFPVKKSVEDHAERFAFISYLPQEEKQIVNSFYESLEQQQQMYIEVSRLIIEEEHRSLPLSMFFVSCIIGIVDALKIIYSIFTCDPHHASFYQRLGGSSFGGLDYFETKTYGKRKTILMSTLTVPDKFKPSIENLKDQFLREGQITYSQPYRKAA